MTTIVANVSHEKASSFSKRLISLSLDGFSKEFSLEKAMIHCSCCFVEGVLAAILVTRPDLRDDLAIGIYGSRDMTAGIIFVRKGIRDNGKEKEKERKKNVKAFYKLESNRQARQMSDG